LEGPTEAAEARNIEVVRKYYDGCNSGDIDELMGTFPPDVTHYFLPSSFPPIHGAEALARHWKWWKDNLDPIWAHDHLIASGDEVVSEWSVIFTPPGSDKRLINRGTEWYVMRDARILEVRAYFIVSAEESVELATFPYTERGYGATPPDVFANLIPA
jgi:ketosteroid isomerase-like protein